jgi:hypothetical protein
VPEVSVDQVAQLASHLNASGATTHDDNVQQPVVVVNSPSCTTSSSSSSTHTILQLPQCGDMVSWLKTKALVFMRMLSAHHTGL